jgi:[protein-PII] uridylyltransferase
MTTRDGYALDTFLLNRAFKDDEDEMRRGKRIGDLIGRLLRGDAWLDTLIAERGHPPRRVMAFTVEPDVIINNALSDQFTVIEVAGRDRPGLLYELTSTLSNLMLDITSAHITTFGEKAVDVFYVTDLTGKKVDSDTRQETIRKRLVGVLDGSEKLARDAPV